ncbi:MAG: hypothetical protein IPM98_16770 [Lewinellaceae bacterium]|nr:hypothetical protein [Lewinellaceae bacterium]
MQIPNPFYLLLGLLPTLSGCQNPGKQASSTELLNYFHPTAATDTLLFEVEHAEGRTPAIGDTIPNSLFFTVLDSVLLSEINYVADASGAVVLAGQRFPLSTDFEACIVDIRQFWFQHQSLLLYDKRQKTFTDRATVAEWYGGDGGQILTGSWLVDYDRDGHKDLVVREIHHTLRPDDQGETHDETHESALLLLWRADRFVEQPLSDTALVVKRFPIRSFW